MKGPLIEDCFCLTPKHVDNTLTRFGRKIGDNRDIKRPDIRYEYDEVGDEQYFIIAIVEGNVPQRIPLDIVDTWFGPRDYFKCEGCDARCQKLYLLPGGHIFRCLKCHKIRRESFNISSKHGKLFDKSRKILKLINEQESMTPRIWYRDNYTRRYSKFLNECLKVGLTDIVKEARRVETAVKVNA